MRGKAAALDHAGVDTGITPAYAGKSGHFVAVRHSSWDHPRLCGEKMISCGGRMLIMGSPPPMRGKVNIRPDTPIQIRITPAYAGKSISSLCSYAFHKDHPRLCGEKKLDRVKHCGTMGSPPPMRGKVNIRPDTPIQIRITPAYAGKREAPTEAEDVCGDHPRLCGEKRLRHANNRSPQGSPPPMRGKVHRFRVFLSKPRITPAYAGKRMLSTGQMRSA